MESSGNLTASLRVKSSRISVFLFNSLTALFWEYAYLLEEAEKRFRLYSTKRLSGGQQPTTTVTWRHSNPAHHVIGSFLDASNTTF
jgi:hypothetical protein